MTMERAAIDRIEGEQAVLLVGEGERQVIVPVAALPPGARAGMWLKVRLENEALAKCELDPETARSREERITDKMRRLFRKGRG
jgi:hypothetical protein